MAPALATLSPGQVPEAADLDWDAGDEHKAWLRRWIHALAQRGDERSLAAADFLESLLAAHDGAAASGPSTQRLHQRALRSGDGFVLALAAMYPCDSALGCKQAVPPDRWPQVEPDNLSAWLAAPPATLPTPDAWLQGVMQASHDNNHRAELMALLQSLPPQLPPGPRRMVRDMALVGINATFLIPRYRPLAQQCRNGADAVRCRALAEQLWTRSEPTLINWMMALALARESPPVAPVWESRAQLAEAASQWSREEAVGMIAEPLVQAYQCKPAPLFERWMHAMLTAGEGAALLGEIKARGRDLGPLSAKYRQENGRSLLQARK